jgi:hypothetical protein
MLSKPILKTEEVFEKIAKAGKTVEYLHSHDAYEGELEERFEDLRVPES